MMKEIYCKATNVIVWLGEASKDSPDAVSLVKSLAATDGLKEAYYKREALTMTEAEMEAFGLPAPWNKDWLALDKLLSRPWFSRIWIIQEVIMSDTAVFLVGGEEVAWNDILLAMLCLGNTNILSLVHGPLSLASVSFLNDIGWYFKHGVEEGRPGLPLHFLLDATRMSISTLREDKVYGLLGLSCDSDSLGIKPDYSISANDLYIKSTRKFLESGDIGILNSNGDLAWKSCQRLPTWVPDWPSYRRETPLNLSRYCPDDNLPDYEFSADSRTLNIRGLEVDIVSRVGNPRTNIRQEHLVPLNNAKLARFQQDFFNLVGFSDQITISSSRRVRMWEKIGFSLKSYPTSEDVATAYYRTLAANMVPPDANLEQCYRLYYRDNAVEMMRAGFLRPGEHDVDSAMYRDLVAYSSQVFSATHGRNIFVTKKGYMGLCPRSTRLGDKLVVLFGGRTPFILRKAKKGKHEFLGECYAHGLMDGEAGKLGLSPQSFAIV
ncbi:hypothetical protein SLS55_003994 [Diplodia seriata]|uniref:Heterokaryon incompatibility domain-containing protein n=1 Tax=Diplodia seriata TaxID=420778 RepID=A0ABR3CI43_9PEZI